MLDLPLTRSQGEMLVDLLETGATLDYQEQRDELAAEIRQLFGMSTKEESDEVKRKFPTDKERWLMKFAKVLATHHEMDKDELGATAGKVLEWTAEVPYTENLPFDFQTNGSWRFNPDL